MKRHVTRAFGAALAALFAVFIPVHDAPAQERATWVRPHPLPADVTPRVQMSECGIWTGFYGPIDYRTADSTVRRRVEVHHFDGFWATYQAWPVLKPLDGNMASNFSYVLRAFPNHPATLLLMESIGRRYKTENIPGSSYPLECWYVRALQTVPDDPMVRAQYGIYLAYRGRPEEARRNLALGDAGLCDSGTMQHQIGLAQLAVGEFRRAQLNAMRAERLGEASEALKARLKAANHWDGAVTLPDDVMMDCETTTDTSVAGKPDGEGK